MAYCESCGSELTDGVKFCKHCGARAGNLDSDAKGISASEFFEEEPEPDGPEFMSASDFFSDSENGTGEESGMISAEEFFSDEDDDIDSIEDGEVDDSKGLDPNRSYHMRISGRSAELYNDWGQFIRRFNMRTNVIQATTSGEMVTICTDDGYTHIYKWDGTFMRRFH